MLRVFTKDNCPDCIKAKTLLSINGIEFETIEINDENIESLKTVGARKAPAIFDGELFLGSYSELRDFIKDSI